MPLRDTPVINAELAMALRKERFETLHLRVRQPVRLLIDQVSLECLNYAKRLKSTGSEPKGVAQCEICPQPLP